MKDDVTGAGGSIAGIQVKTHFQPKQTKSINIKSYFKRATSGANKKLMIIACGQLLMFLANISVYSPPL